jgi:hypothetical protein
MSITDRICVTLISAGMVGMSFAASHLAQARNCEVIIYDTRADIMDSECPVSQPDLPAGCQLGK